MAFAQNLRIFKEIMLAILSIWLCLFSKNFSIVTKTLIVGQHPRRPSDNALSAHIFVKHEKLSSEYYIYACGNFSSLPRSERKPLFSDTLLVTRSTPTTHHFKIRLPQQK